MLNRNYVLSVLLSLWALDAASQETKTVVAGDRYENAPGGAWILGADYRDLRSTAIQVEVLDLSTEAGGLRPVTRVVGMQTLGLALTSADGKDYTFRGVDKDPTELVPEEFRDTPVEMIVHDQIAGNFPVG